MYKKAISTVPILLTSFAERAAEESGQIGTRKL